MTHENVAQRTCDVLIIGSGAAGLAAAVTAAFHGLEVIVAEKAETFGGTSAWSGGWLWIPRNPLAVAAGIQEDPAEPRRYLQSELGNRANDPRVEVFLENGPAMVSFFADHSDIQWIDGNRIPDFHETPGRAHGGRSVSVAPYDGRKLGDWIHRLSPPLDVISLAGMGIASGADLTHFFNATRRPASAWHVLRRLAKHGRDLALQGRSLQLVNGNALVAGLLKTAVDLGVTLLHGAPAREILRDGGAVTGAVLERGGAKNTIHTRKAVVLATGGFPHDPARQAAHFDHTPDGVGHYSAAPKTNTGDGLRLAESSGAALDFDLAEPGAWAPVSLVPDGAGGWKHFPHLVDRAKPGFMAVDKAGRRFVNEADSYHDFMKTLLQATPAGEKPFCWLICDHRAQRRYGLGWSKPFPFPLAPYFRNGYLQRGRSLAALAQACDLPPKALEDSVARFNGAARQGADADFERGASAYNRIQGDPENLPNPSLGALEKAPFYAVKIVPGSLGTFAGIKTSAQGQALAPDGTPVPGLYAAGNDMASIMGGNYPSGGITLGPGMTFGYVIGRVLAGQPLHGAAPAPAFSNPQEQDQNP
ncbi:MAG: FAD-dependent oxidoreductase [Magnetospiraceae bacterium]